MHVTAADRRLRPAVSRSPVLGSRGQRAPLQGPGENSKDMENSEDMHGTAAALCPGWPLPGLRCMSLLAPDFERYPAERQYGDAEHPGQGQEHSLPPLRW